MTTLYTPPITINVPTGTGGGGVDIDVVSSLYEVVVTASGYALGDTLQKLSFFSAGAAAAGTSDLWYNLTTNVALAGAPLTANVKPAKSSGITKTELENTVLTTEESDTSPVFTHFGKSTDVAAPSDGSGSFSILAGIKRLVLSVIGISEKIPVLVNGKLPITSEAQWATTEYKLNSALMVIFEKEYNGTTYRQRTWTSTTDAQGVTSYVAGEWA